MPKITNLTIAPRSIRIANGKNGEERYETLQPGEAKNVEPLSRNSLIGEELAGVLLIEDAPGKATAEATGTTPEHAKPGATTRTTPTAADRG